MEHVDFNCIFCAIAAKRAPSALVFENAKALAFLDLRPIVEGHTLVIPKQHCRNLFDFDEAVAGDVMRVARVVARALRIAQKADGMNLFQSSERAAGQEVFHFHFHLVPRFVGDGLFSRESSDRLMHWRTRGNPTLAELEVVAARVRAEIKET